ncbi:MAG: hypothetical protein WKG06_24055 [Segetibacter sp.]
MKKITFLLIYTIAVMLTLSKSVNAQKRYIASNSSALNNTFLSPFEKMGFKETKANNFNIRAVRDFVRTFKTISSNKWFLAEDGSSTSTFNSNGITTTVLYDSKGYRQYIIRIYEENKLQADIRHMIKREYYDATITLVKEVEANDGLLIFVHMQDKYTWKIVQVADGEMKLVQNLTKS